MSSPFRLRKIWFQSAPLREGRPSDDRACDGLRGVSIRAPARGATRGGNSGAGCNKVSIRAPARGATRLTSGRLRLPDCFNPRPCARGDTARWVDRFLRDGFQSAPLREGRRSAFTCVWLRSSRVSIRAPARGATGLELLPEVVVDLVSIRAPARGATRTGWRRWARWAVSIRAPARGATDEAFDPAQDRLGFNPRPCARGDSDSVTHDTRASSVSIRAPARGATFRRSSATRDQ